MDLYFSPMACSLASRIALYEAGGEVRFIEVDPKTKRTLDGADYLKIYPLGLVPLLRLDDGSLLSENAAILQYIAGRYPQAGLAPADEDGRAHLGAAHLERITIGQVGRDFPIVGDGDVGAPFSQVNVIAVVLEAVRQEASSGFFSARDRGKQHGVLPVGQGC